MGGVLRRRWPWILLGGLGVALVAFLAWALIIPAPMALASAAMQSNGQVDVQAGGWLTFRPEGREPAAGLVVYPGGRVDYRAYAPAARATAGEAFLVAIVPMPLNLAVFGSGRAAAGPGVDAARVGVAPCFM
jgi:hypothetical protein